MRKHSACAAKAGRNFIYYQMHFKTAAQGTHALQVAGIVHDHAGSALHQRFDDQGCGVGMVLL